MPKKKPKVTGNGVCVICRVPFFYHSVHVPTNCGALYCTAMDSWGPEEWQGAADMARARAYGVVRTVIELHYLRDGLSWLCGCKTGEEMTKNHGEHADFRRVEKEIVVEMTPLDKEALRRFP